MSSVVSKGKTRRGTKEPSHDTSSPPLRKMRNTHQSSIPVRSNAPNTPPPQHHEDNDDEGEEERAQLPVIRARTRKVANATVLNKWVKLPEAARQEISTVLRDLERPVLAAMRSDHRRTEAQKVLHAAIASIEKKLAKVPVPPSQIVELEAELAEERSLLQEEKKALLLLTRNSKMAQTSWNNDQKRMHDLLQLQDSQRTYDINLADHVDDYSYNVEADRAISTLRRQLGQHIVSIETNTASLRGEEGLMSIASNAEAALLTFMESRKLDGFQSALIA